MEESVGTGSARSLFVTLATFFVDDPGVIAEVFVVPALLSFPSFVLASLPVKLLLFYDMMGSYAGGFL